MKDIAVRDVTITKHVRSNDLLSDSGDPSTGLTLLDLVIENRSANVFQHSSATMIQDHSFALVKLSPSF